MYMDASGAEEIVQLAERLPQTQNRRHPPAWHSSRWIGPKRVGVIHLPGARASS